MEWGEVMWRQYELPTNIRTMQFADPNKFKREVEKREEYHRLKEFEGKEVEAELYKLPDGQVRAWRVKPLQPLYLQNSQPAALTHHPAAAPAPSAAMPSMAAPAAA